MAAPESKNYIRAFLRRTYTLNQLQALSLAIGASVITGDCSAVEVLLTNAGFEGGNAGGVVRGVDRLDIGAICEELISEMEGIADGGMALTAYAKLQYVDMTEKEREELTSGLKKYCELDTLAMVMIYEHFREITR